MKKSNIIDGKYIASLVIEEVKDSLKDLASKNIIPGLAVIMVGNDLGSRIYVNRKREMAIKIGMESYIHHFEENITTETLKSKVKELNEDPTIHGILVQLPLPKHIDTLEIINSINE